MKNIVLLLLVFFSVPYMAYANYDRGLAAFNQGDYATAMKEFIIAAEKGHAGAQFNLGNMYANGIGVLVDDAKAVRWYQEAAEQGTASLLFFLKFAAEQGDVYSQFQLANMYVIAPGVSKNYIMAYKWKILSAAQGVESSHLVSHILERDMDREQIAEAQRLATEFHPRKEKGQLKTPKMFFSMDSGPDNALFFYKDEHGVLHFFGFKENTQPPLDQKFVPDTPRHTPKPDPVREAELVSTGTGFFVTNQGHVLTNNHVVESCAQVRVTVPAGTSNASILALHQNDDLALLLTSAKPPAIASFRRTAAEVGEDVSVAGYPLHGLLGGLNVTSGSVASATGLRGDARYLQISAPVQPGNSGGPLLDSAGTVVGVVVAKLDAVAMAQATGDIPQNVNFAIKSAVARSFLNIHGIEYKESSPRRDKTRVAIAAEAQQHTVLVECWK